MQGAPYRGKDIGGRRCLEEFCLRAFETGRAEQLLEILPHISLLRSTSFIKPLSTLLKSSDRDKQLFAALALGSLGASETVDVLFDSFMCPTTVGSGSQPLQAAIILALGDTGEKRAVQALCRILDENGKLDSFGRDSFGTARRMLVASSLGTLLHFDVEEALEPLLRLAGSSAPLLRGHTAMELGVAYWHRPQTTPASVLSRLTRLSEDWSPEVRNAALAALYNLAELGCAGAEHFFRRDERQLA